MQRRSRETHFSGDWSLWLAPLFNLSSSLLAFTPGPCPFNLTLVQLFLIHFSFLFSLFLKNCSCGLWHSSFCQWERGTQLDSRTSGRELSPPHATLVTTERDVEVKMVVLREPYTGLTLLAFPLKPDYLYPMYYKNRTILRQYDKYLGHWGGLRVKWNHLSPPRIVIIKKLENKYWWGYGAIEAFMPCWWKTKMVQSLGKTVWRPLKKLNRELPYDPAIPCLACTQEDSK